MSILGTYQEIHLLGFHSSVNAIGLPVDDYIDTWRITMTPSLNCELMEEKIEFFNHGDGPLDLSPHFRYAGGSDIFGEGGIRIFASTRGTTRPFNVNLYQLPVDWCFKVESSGKAATNVYGMNPVTGNGVGIDGGINLEDYIHDEHGGAVYTIETQSDYIGPFAYTLIVDAKGPKGATHSLDLKFTDKTGDIYSLMIYDSTRKKHTLKYSSYCPLITRISW